MVTVTEARVLEALAAVMDPEIATVSIVDLGIVERIDVRPGEIEVELLPTFSGCPALDVIREDVERALRAIDPKASVTVRYTMSTPWTTDRISAEGREALKEYGIAPPGEPLFIELARPATVRCPYCGARDTEEQSAFGPTPCRAVRYCASCRNPFESFKAKR